MIKKVALSILFISIFGSYAQAGFFSSILSTAIGTSLANSGKGTVYVSQIKTRMNRVNDYLWHMHQTKKYTKNYKFYLKWLENSINKSGYDDISLLDTIAWVYKDHGDKKKAIKIYQTRILPWVDLRFEDDKYGKNRSFREKWLKSYNAIKK